MSRRLGSVVLFAAAALCARAQAAGRNQDFDDMTPGARALFAAAREHPEGLTLAGIHADALSEPATIRVWRRGLDHSTDSCAGRVDVIPFEDYVKGVVPHEWIPSWDSRALEMGAVCARSFAWSLVKSGGKYSCADVDDTAASQVYKDDRNSRTDAAVDATRGVVVMRNGALVLAEYSAENGDPTAFGVDEPYCSGQTVNGHGRGTCQWGTQRWAINEGRDYVWMIAHYYPGAQPSGPPVARWSAGNATVIYPAHMIAGDAAQVTVQIVDTGFAAWDASTHLGTSGPRGRTSPFHDDSWLAPATPAAISAPTPAGGVATFTFKIIAPDVDATTSFTETFGVVTGSGAGTTWMGPDDDRAVMTITVDPDQNSACGCRVGAAGGPAARLGLLAAAALVLGLLVFTRRR